MSGLLNQLIFLGTGTSTGIPIVGCQCSVCTSSNKKNNRLRSSVYIKTKKGFSFIIDTGPDLRTQLLRSKVQELDFAILTHDHADHIHGLDDLRPFTFFPKKREIPVFCHSAHFSKIQNKFDYIFKRKEISPPVHHRSFVPIRGVGFVRSCDCHGWSLTCLMYWDRRRRRKDNLRRSKALNPSCTVGDLSCAGDDPHP